MESARDSGDVCGRDVRAQGLQTSRCALPEKRPWCDGSSPPPGFERSRSVGARQDPAHDGVHALHPSHPRCPDAAAVCQQIVSEQESPNLMATDRRVSSTMEHSQRCSSAPARMEKGATTLCRCALLHARRGLDNPRERACLTALHHFLLTRPTGRPRRSGFAGSNYGRCVLRSWKPLSYRQHPTAHCDARRARPKSRGWPIRWSRPSGRS